MKNLPVRDVCYRPAESKDAKGLFRLFGYSQSPELGPAAESLREILENPTAADSFIVAICGERVVGSISVSRFEDSDPKYPDWWILVQHGRVDLCVNDPGREIDVYFTTTVRTMADVWMGKRSYRKVIADKDMTLVGHKALINDVSAWMECSIFAGIAPATEI